MKKDFNSQDLEELLRNRYCPPAWAFIPQVRNGTGFLKQTRTADALAMSLWPSRGLHIYGFEIKVNRGDWLAELKRPDKAEELAQFCDYWWIVSPKDIIKLGEIPETWGWLVPHGATVRAVKEAKKMEALPVDSLLLASILRRAQDIVVPGAKLAESFKAGQERGKKITEDSFKWEKERHLELEKKIKTFEEKSGLEIDTWQLGDIAEAVRMIVNGEHLRVKKHLEDLYEQATNIAETIKKEIELKV